MVKNLIAVQQSVLTLIYQQVSRLVLKEAFKTSTVIFLATLPLLGFMMLTVPLIEVLWGVEVSLWFLIFGLIILVPGLLVRSQVKMSVEITLLDSIIASVMMWLLFPAVSAIPLSLTLKISYLDAFFENVSGFTGTGFTVLRGLDKMSPGILFWRALAQWSGELGFVVFAMVFIPYFYRIGLSVYGLERPVKLETSFYATAKRLVWIYTLLTIVGAVALYLSGMEPFDALVFSMTGVATGGMSNYDANYDYVYRQAPLTVYPLIAVMILGATNFALLDRLLKGDVKSVVSNEEFKLYVVALTLLGVLNVVAVYWGNYSSSFQEATISGLFNAISALTTTGFNIGSIGDLPPGSKLVLVTSMIIGGMTFATAGGIKVLRLLVFLKWFKTTSENLVTGRKVSLKVKLDRHIVGEVEIATALLGIVVHLLAVMTGSAIIKLIMPERDFLDALFEASSAAGCVGLSVGIIGQTAPPLVKATLIPLMILGKLEYLPLYGLVGILMVRKYFKILK